MKFSVEDALKVTGNCFVKKDVHLGGGGNWCGSISIEIASCQEKRDTEGIFSLVEFNTIQIFPLLLVHDM
jgi:hypothetical protein